MRGDARGEAARPVRPVERAALVQQHGHREGARLPRLGEDRAVAVARDLWGDGAGERDAVFVDLWEPYLEAAA